MSLLNGTGPSAGGAVGLVVRPLKLKIGAQTYWTLGDAQSPQIGLAGTSYPPVYANTVVLLSFPCGFVAVSMGNGRVFVRIHQRHSGVSPYLFPLKSRSPTAIPLMCLMLLLSGFDAS